MFFLFKLSLYKKVHFFKWKYIFLLSYVGHNSVQLVNIPLPGYRL
jgi:hypothetical protein